MKRKLVVIAAANNFHFISDIVQSLSEWFNVDMVYLSFLAMSFGETNKQIVESDIVWFEWTDGLCLDFLMHSPFLANKKVILRLHRYELFTPRTLALIQRLTDSGNYKKIDKLIFVSNFVRQIGISKFPWMKDISVVIPNLFDHTKFPMAADKKGYHNLLFLCRISYVKNLPLCLTMFHELLGYDNKYKLHIVGEITDPELKYYAENFIANTKIGDNIMWFERIPHENISRLMEVMSYIICSSISEAHPVGIIESMCCGLKPVIFDFPGAENMYPEKWRWIGRIGFVDNILSPDCNPQEYRDYAINGFSIEKNIDKYKDLINEVLKGE